MSTETTKSNKFSSPEAKSWFDDFVGKIRVDQVTLETDTAGTQKSKFFNDLIYGDGIESSAMARHATTQHLVKTILLDYIDNLASRRVAFNSLAFDISNDKICVWVEIETDDEHSENNLVLAEAETNAKFFRKTGLSVESTIVEQIDALEIPPHYYKVQIGAEE